MEHDWDDNRMICHGCGLTMEMVAEAGPLALECGTPETSVFVTRFDAYHKGYRAGWAACSEAIDAALDAHLAP